MKLLAVIVVTLTLMLMVEKVKPTVTDDEKIDNSIIELEEELYQLTKQDTQEKKTLTKDSVGSTKKGLRAPCGFSESCTRRRSSGRRRRGLWGKKSEDNHAKHQQTTHSSFAQDDFDQVLSDITKLAKEIRNEKKNKEDFRQH